MQLSTDQIAALNRDNRQTLAATPDGLPGILQDILDAQEAAGVGSTAAAWDADAAAPANTLLARNADTTIGLTLGYRAGKVRFAGTLVSVSAGTVTLPPSATSYVEVDSTGTVSSNTTGFSAKRIPLYTVVTGVSTIATVTPTRYPLFALPAGGVTGELLSTAAASKALPVNVGTIGTGAGTTAVRVRVPTTLAAGSKLTKVSFVTASGLAASDTNYLTFGVVNKGAGGAGTQVLADAAAAANSTKATGGSALAADVPRDLTLATLTVGTERDVTGGDVLAISLTVTGTLAGALAACSLLLEFGFAN